VHLQELVEPVRDPPKLRGDPGLEDTSVDLRPDHSQIRLLSDVAPEINVDAVDPELPLQEQFDLDSMDLLNYIARLEEGADIRIHEPDYAKVSSLSSAVAYLERAPHLASS
jgi:acyl carrier protein